MAYTPKIHTIDLRPAVSRIFEFIAAEQVEAFEWAGHPELVPIKKFYTSAVGRLSTIFPHFMLYKKQMLTKPGDVIEAVAQFDFEVAIESSDTDKLVQDAEQYALVLGSLLSNIPKGTFDNTEPPNVGHQAFFLESLDTAYDEIAGAVNNPDAFLQSVKLRAVYQLRANVFVQ